MPSVNDPTRRTRGLVRTAHGRRLGKPDSLSSPRSWSRRPGNEGTPFGGSRHLRTPPQCV